MSRPGVIQVLRNALLLLVLPALAISLIGCGSGGSPLAPAPSPGGPEADLATHEVGPLVIRTASAAGFVAENIPSEGSISFAALHGATIDYMAAREMMDRVVFHSMYDSPDHELWVCDLFGDDLTQLTNNSVHDCSATWSPDGTQIAWSRTRSLTDDDIIVMDADGSNAHVVGDSSAHDSHPTWSPDGSRLVFETDRDGNWEIYRMYTDGLRQTNLTNSSGSDEEPEWAPDTPRILFTSDRSGTHQVYVMNEDGSAPTCITAVTDNIGNPTWHPDGNQIAYSLYLQASNWEVVLDDLSGSSRREFSGSSDIDMAPCFSSDGSLVVFKSYRNGPGELFAKETSAPYRVYQITDMETVLTHPDLGSPVPTTRRVLIGPAGSDHGYDPTWSSAYAGVVGFDETGYVNFVRIGVRTQDVDTIEMHPMQDTGWGTAGVTVEAAEIVNLRQDNGPGRDPTVWDLDAQDPGALLLYFNVWDGKLVHVLVTSSSVSPSAATAGEVTHSVQGDRTQVAGAFAAVYDQTGAMVARDVGTVEFRRARLVRAF